MRLMFILYCIAIQSILWSQDVPFKSKYFKDNKSGFQEALKNLQDGNLLYYEGAYIQSLSPLLKAQNFNPKNAILNYKIGHAFYNCVGQQNVDTLHNGIITEEMALEYLIKADSLEPELNRLIFSDIRIEVDYKNSLHYLIGRCLHLNMEYQDAQLAYERCLEDLENLQDLNMAFSKAKAKRDLQRLIKSCQYGLKTKSAFIPLYIKNLGSNINSIYPDYGPLIDLDESLLFFTSRRPGPHTLEEERTEDIYFTLKSDSSEWVHSQILDTNINTSMHEATVGLSFDGQRIFIYKSDNQNSGDLYISQLEGESWSNPEPLSKSVNSRYQESSACFSPDERTLYFVSNRPNGLGGKDIYYCVKQRNGQWSSAMSIGQGINTKYDEDGVYMHPDGKTLFFSSQGHDNLGGYDIFKSKLEDGQWSTPQNLGYPINTPGDDIYFILNASSTRAYVSSSRRGSLGDKDIFQIEFPENYWSSTNDNYSEVVILKGKVLDMITQKPLEAEVLIIDNIADSITAQFKSNAKTGEYKVALESGRNYGIVIQKEERLFHSENINIPKGEFREIKKDVKLQKIKMGSRLVLKNIFFKSGSTDLMESSYSELNRLVRFLKRFNTLQFEIAGHTDNIGSPLSNKKLSESRAKAIYTYLINNGINSKRLTYKGYGDSEPIADNNTEEGRQKNRRTEFKIIQ